ncbi:MAG: hypothetical protein JNJ77_04945 [Planctomycetia bacterium]|nr:hypothetical protein [Planctomycetia bacterium]
MKLPEHMKKKQGNLSNAASPISDESKKLIFQVSCPCGRTQTFDETQAGTNCFCDCGKELSLSAMDRLIQPMGGHDNGASTSNGSENKSEFLLSTASLLSLVAIIMIGGILIAFLENWANISRLYAFVCGVVCAICLCRDASNLKEQGVSLSPALWTILGFLVSAFAVLIYVTLRSLIWKHSLRLKSKREQDQVKPADFSATGGEGRV